MEQLKQIEETINEQFSNWNSDNVPLLSKQLLLWHLEEQLRMLTELYPTFPPVEVVKKCIEIIEQIETLKQSKP
jgi:hypothetical protein